MLVLIVTGKCPVVETAAHTHSIEVAIKGDQRQKNDVELLAVDELISRTLGFCNAEAIICVQAIWFSWRKHERARRVLANNGQITLFPTATSKPGKLKCIDLSVVREIQGDFPSAPQWSE